MIEQVEYMASIAPDPAGQQMTIATIRQQAARMMDPALPLNTPASELLGAPAAYWKDLNAYKPVAVAATLTVPLLVLQGERDYQVTMKVLMAGEKASGRPALRSELSDLNHAF